MAENVYQNGSLIPILGLLERTLGTISTKNIRIKPEIQMVNLTDMIDTVNAD